MTLWIYDHCSYFVAFIFKMNMVFFISIMKLVSGKQLGYSVLRTSSQDGGFSSAVNVRRDFRLENLKNTLRDMLRSWLLLLSIVVLVGLDTGHKFRYMYKCILNIILEV